jgi:hypothetical protein
MKRRLLIVVGALVFVLVPAGSTATSASAWTDPPGDSGGAPDITSVLVSDASDKTVTFRIAGRFAPTTGVLITVDAVKNGVEIARPRSVWLSVDAAGAASGGVSWWRGAPIPEIPVTAAVTADAATISFSAPALEIDDMFVFRLFSHGSGSVDNVPDFSGMLFYKLTPPSPPPVVKPVVSSPVTWAAPLAGKRFTVFFRITRSDNGAAASTAKVACATSLAGRTIAHRHAFTSGNLKVTLVLPKTARGKRLTVDVKVALDRQKTRRAFIFSVK